MKATLPPWRPIAATTCFRATSIAAAASRPQREGECGLANLSSIHGLHRLGHFGRNRRRRLIIEVDHAPRFARGSRCAAIRREAVDFGLARLWPEADAEDQPAISGGTPIAARTRLGFMLPDEQALPAETAMPARSNWTS